MPDYGKMKIEGAIATTPPSEMSRLMLVDAPAEEAVTCMRNEGAMPAKPPFDYIHHSGSVVSVLSDGLVSVTEFGIDSGRYAHVDTDMVPAQYGDAARVSGPQGKVTGSAAETMRQKARACAFNGLPKP